VHFRTDASASAPSRARAGAGALRPGLRPGLYVHVPFCARLCHYCDFARIAETDPAVHHRYVTALRTEIERLAAGGPWPVFGSLFVGGGTPTLLPATELAGVISLAREVLPFAPDAEITVEANPETVDESYFAALVDGGVNRVSMGAQSFAFHVLAFLGRWHAPDRPLQAVAAARAAGVSRVSLDLIYGSPAETAADWVRSLDLAIEAGTDHLSAYALTLEPNTTYARQVRSGAKPAPDDDVAAQRMTVAAERLAGAGFRRYEISNWARPGAECRHNLTYWRGGRWLAAGAGAHGSWGARRWWNVRAPGRYAEAVLGVASPVAGEEILDEAARRAERLMLGLRLAEGVPCAEVEPLDEAVVADLVDSGLLLHDGRRVALTASGMAVANAVTIRLL
jgi:putative oxygen-independent coproporphyrinogen III oxidase